MARLSAVTCGAKLCSGSVLRLQPGWSCRQVQCLAAERLWTRLSAFELRPSGPRIELWQPGECRTNSRILVFRAACVSVAVFCAVFRNTASLRASSFRPALLISFLRAERIFTLLLRAPFG